MTKKKYITLLGAVAALVVCGVAAFGQNPGQILVTTPTGNELIALQTAGPQSAAISTTNLATWISGGGGGASPGVFTTLSASGAVTGAGFTARFATPGPIGNTVASTGAFTTLSASTSATLSPSGVVTINPTTAGAVDNVTVGATTPLAGTFTALSATTSATISPSGTVALSPTGALTVNPTAASTINNTSVGVTTSAAGKFTTLQNTTSAGLTVAVSTDATHTDSTLCQDTTTHVVYFGSGTAGICLGTSSLRFKHDVAPLEVGLRHIMQLEPISYKLNETHGDADHTLYGFSAEQGGKVLPILMGKDVDGNPNTFDYLGVVPVLVKAIQEQQAQIEDLKRRLPVKQAVK